MNKLIVTLVVAALALHAFSQEREGTYEYGRGRGRRPNPDVKLHRFSTTIKKERPQLNQETRDLIAAYRRDPSDANRAALRRQVTKNYDAVIARKATAGYPTVTFRVVREDR